MKQRNSKLAAMMLCMGFTVSVPTFYLWYGRKCVEHFAAKPKNFRTGC